MKTIILDIGDESADWIKHINKKILKAKVYVKDPGNAPAGVKVERGKRGGYYYENKFKTEDVPTYLKGLKYDGKTDIKLEYYHTEYDIWQTKNGANILIPADDIPTDITKRVESIDNMLKHTKKKPNIIFLGKKMERKFTWNSKSGKSYESFYGGHYTETGALPYEIAIYDDSNVDDILPHEIGHFVQHNIMLKNPVEPDKNIEDLLTISDINSYIKVVNIVSKYNIDTDKIKQILDDKWLDDEELVEIVDEFRTNKLGLYGEGYSALWVMENRMLNGKSPEISAEEIKLYKKSKKEQKTYVESNTLFAEWNKIYKEEGFDGNDYAARNSGEAFAEMYQNMYYFLESNENYKDIEMQHPKKFNFMKNHIFDKKLIEQQKLIGQQKHSQNWEMQTIKPIISKIEMPQIMKLDNTTSDIVSYDNNTISVNKDYYNLDINSKKQFIGQEISKIFTQIPEIKERIIKYSELALGDYDKEGKFIGAFGTESPDEAYRTLVGYAFQSKLEFIRDFGIAKYNLISHSMPINGTHIMNLIFERLEQK